MKQESIFLYQTIGAKTGVVSKVPVVISHIKFTKQNNKKYKEVKVQYTKIRSLSAFIKQESLSKQKLEMIGV